MFLLGGSHTSGAFFSVSTCLFVWVSSFFSSAPPSYSSLHEALTPVPLAAASHLPQPPAGPYEGVGGGPGSPLPQIRDWLAETLAGGVRRERYFC